MYSQDQHWLVALNNWRVFWKVLLVGVGIVVIAWRTVRHVVRPPTEGLSRVTRLDIAYLRGWILPAFLWAPSPFFACVDVCGGPPVILPFALSWVLYFTLFSLIFPLTWVWHILFMGPFLGVFVPLDVWLESRLRGNWRKLTKRSVFVLAFLVYWAAIASLWRLIPLTTQRELLGLADQ
jgi:hypothetical protein